MYIVNIMEKRYCLQCDEKYTLSEMEFTGKDMPTLQETVDEDSFFSGALISGHNFVSM